MHVQQNVHICLGMGFPDTVRILTDQGTIIHEVNQWIHSNLPAIYYDIMKPSCFAHSRASIMTLYIWMVISTHHRSAVESQSMTNHLDGAPFNAGLFSCVYVSCFWYWFFCVLDTIRRIPSDFFHTSNCHYILSAMSRRHPLQSTCQGNSTGSDGQSDNR